MKDWFTIAWRDEKVVLLDQRELPEREVYLELEEPEAVAVAIETMAIRGAPAIGCAAALGIALAAMRSEAATPEDLIAELERHFDRFVRTRPTAVNLFFALSEMRKEAERFVATASADATVLRRRLLERAQALLREDVASCRRIGEHGASLIPAGSKVLTHCNAGALATAGFGTALGVVRAAAARFGNIEVLANETRPLLQGARLTAWELERDKIPVSVLTDGMAADLMRRGKVDLVIVGADRIASNGDVANKIGTYSLAVLARAHGLPFYVAAPLASVDFGTASGDSIPIEERDPSEITRQGERRLVPRGVPALNPAFDVTQASLIDAIITEAGIARPPFTESLRAQASQRD